MLFHIVNGICEIDQGIWVFSGVLENCARNACGAERDQLPQADVGGALVVDLSRQLLSRLPDTPDNNVNRQSNSLLDNF